MRTFWMSVFCFAFFFTALPPASHAEAGDVTAVNSGENWFYIEQKDIMTDLDSSMVIATPRNQGSYISEGLVFRCDGPEVDIFVHFNAYIGSTRRDSQEVIYRFLSEDDRPEAKRGEWNVSSRKTSVYVPFRGRRNFIRNVVKYDTLIVRTFDHRGSPKTLEINLTNEEGFLRKLSCLAKYL